MKNRQVWRNEPPFASHAAQAEDRASGGGASPAFANGYVPASVMIRGHHGDLIFRDEGDRIRFLETFAEVCRKTAWRVDA